MRCDASSLRFSARAWRYAASVGLLAIGLVAFLPECRAHANDAGSYGERIQSTLDDFSLANQSHSYQNHLGLNVSSIRCPTESNEHQGHQCCSLCVGWSLLEDPMNVVRDKLLFVFPESPDIFELLRRFHRL